jgi:DNA-binding NarL/FixJ family response regulator
VSVRLVIADDHALFRQGVRSLLELHDEIAIVAEVERVDDLRGALDEVGCDVLLLDLQMDRWSGDDVEWLSRRAKVIVLTASERREDALGALRLGARAIVHKRFAIETLMEAIRAVAAGHVWMPPELQAEITSLWAEGEPLTAREREIVALVGRGLRNGEIAQQLFISEVTVKTHLNRIFAKIGARDRVELALYAVRVGLASVRSSST